MMGCGKIGSSSNPVTTLPDSNITPVSPSDFIDDSINQSSGTITTRLISLHPSLATTYSNIDMELNIGTVIGNHTDLDANQGGDIVFHKRHNNGGGISYSYFTSGGNTLDDVKENYWSYNSEGKLVWRGVFEGPGGALVIVVDGVYESGDGNDPFDYMSGSIWYRPWPIVSAHNAASNACVYKNGRLDCKNPSGPLVRCWDVSIGPYDCRFSVSDDSQTVSTVGNDYTEGGFIKIAEFYDLSRERTFKESY